MHPKISIIIPCYNHGYFLKDTLLNLVPNDNFYEVIIVNDGSNDGQTLLILNQLQEKGFRIITQTNQGLSAARNAGIAQALGSYIMLLDSDNKLETEFLKSAAREFELNPEIAVVYSDAMYFGDKHGYWKVGEFNLQRLMIANYIDACAMVRKSVFIDLGGYDLNMKGGWEDWELWLRIAFSGRKFKYISSIGFWYRTTEHSMSGGLGKNTAIRNNLKEYLHNKYPSLLGQDYITNFVVARLKKNPIKFLLKMFTVAWFPSIYKKLLKKNMIIKGL